MNKTFVILLVLTLFTSGLPAQSLQLQTRSGQIIPNGGTVGLKWTLYDTTWDVTMELYMKNISSSSLSYKVIKTIKTLNTPQKSYFCFAQGCFSDTTTISPTTLTIEAGKTDSDFTAHISPHNYPGSSVIYYKFYNTRDNNDSTGVFIQTEIWHLGINDPSNSQPELGFAYPNPANERFFVDYTLAGPEPAFLILKNILGSTIREEPITVSGNGKIQIDVTDLPGGVYFYSLYVRGNNISTRKLLVRH